MKAYRLFTLKTVALQLLCSGALALLSDAAYAACSPQQQATCDADPSLRSACLSNGCNISALAGDGCTKVAAELGAANDVIQAKCGGESSSPSKMKQCLSKAYKCKDARDQVKTEVLEDDETGADDCSALAKECPEFSGISREDALREKKEAKERRRELEKQRDEALSKKVDAQGQGADDANKMLEQQQNEDQKYRQSRKELTDKLQKDLADIDDAKLKSLKQAQDDYDKIDVEYIKFRDQLRRKTSSANDTELTWNTQCRSAADDVAQKVEAAFDQRMAAEDQMVRNYQMTSSAGKLNRKLKEKRQKILNKYNEFMAKCLRGDVDPGAGLKLKLSQTKNDLRDSQAEANDRAARLEKLRLQILDNLNQLKQSLDKKTQMLVQQNQEALQMLDQDHQAAMQRMQRQQMTNMMKDMQKNQNQGQQDQRLNDQIREAMKDEALASAHAKCNGSMPKELAAETRAETKALGDALGKILGFCNKPTGNFNCNSSTSSGTSFTALQNQCSQLANDGIPGLKRSGSGSLTTTPTGAAGAAQ